MNTECSAILFRSLISLIISYLAAKKETTAYTVIKAQTVIDEADNTDTLQSTSIRLCLHNLRSL